MSRNLRHLFDGSWITRIGAHHLTIDVDSKHRKTKGTDHDFASSLVDAINAADGELQWL